MRQVSHVVKWESPPPAEAEQPGPSAVYADQAMDLSHYEKGGDVDLSGWERRTTIDEPRLSELVETYLEMGFEVVLRPVSGEEPGEECSECHMAEPERFRTIYTRRRQDTAGG